VENGVQILKHVLGAVLFVGVFFGLIFIAYEDGIPITLIKKIKCHFGYHSIYVRFGKAKINKYYCLVCKKPRNHPGLKIVDGGNKMSNNKFEF
jgi:hypothetical protein